MNEDWKVRELTEALRRSEANAAKDRSYIEQLRLELDKHRWVSVSERIPTAEDAYKGQVFVFISGEAESWPFYDLDTATYWKPIIPPEEV
jgi:hypothetical protein